MRPFSLKTLAGAVLTTAVALAIVGCKGSTGAAGANGTNGTNGTNGSNGAAGANGTNGVFSLDASQMTTAQWSALTLQGAVTNVDLSKGTPAVTFTLTDGSGHPVFNLSKPGPDGLTSHFGFSIAKLIPGANGSASRWVNYMFVKAANGSTAASLTGFPDPETSGTLTESATTPGTYTYTFALDITQAASIAASVTLGANQSLATLDDLSYDTSKVYRVLILAGGAPTSTPGAIPVFKPANIVYDFLPSAPNAALPAGTDERMIVTQTACNGCHTKLTMHAQYMVPVQTTQACVMCHTQQMAFGQPDSYTAGSSTLTPAPMGATFVVNGAAVPMFPNFIHKIHMGENLSLSGYTLFGTPFNTEYPQDVKNCTTCHVTQTATPDATNWQMVPTRVACSSCHDSVNFATGANHGPTSLIQTDDSQCAGCHNPDGKGSFIAIYHVPVTPPDSTNAGLPAPQGQSSNSHTNAAYVTGNQANLPAGAAAITWKLINASVVPTSTITPGAAGSTITWTFQILNNGTPVAINPSALSGNYSATATPELMNGFAGGPTLYMVYSAPQDGIAAPVDYNGSISVNLHKLWRGAYAAPNGVSQDLNTLNITAVYNQGTVPTGSGMLTAGIGYNYGVVAQSTWSASTFTQVLASQATDSLPLTQTNLPAYPYGAWNSTTTPLPFQGGLQVAAPNVWMTLPGQTARRAIVSTAKCQSCHQNLGVFTADVFHSGQRNNAESCTFCHNANSMDSGWCYNEKEFVHALHAASVRSTPYTWQSSHEYFNLGYPGLLNNCEACHLPGTYDVSNVASQVPNMLWDTAATGAAAAAGVVLTKPANYSATATYLSPIYVPNTNYGAAISYNTGLAAKTNVKWPSITGSVAQTTITSVAVGASVEADPYTLVNSPITAACMACHDGSMAAAHMTANGGKIATPRSQVVSVTATAAGGTTVTTPIVQSESCTVCHGAGQIADVTAVHMNF